MDNANKSADGIGHNWGWILAYGILLIVVGFFAMWHPLATGLATGIVLSVSFAFGGVGSLIAAFQDAGWQAKTVDILFGILMLFAAFVFLVNPFGSAVSVVWVLGVIFLVMGGYEFVAGFRTNHTRVWLILLGMVDMLLGFWAAFMMQADAALVALAAIVGMLFVFRGALLSAFALVLRNMRKA